jgi:prepilin-type N-terminal cleavage/methylation domain-containing protein
MLNKLDKTCSIDRRGMTLVELLIVIAVIVTVSAIILPSLKESLKDQKITQASRQIQGMIESCKAQALASGRPVGISLERLSAESLEGIATSIQIVRMEELPPYTGDFQECGAYLSTTVVAGPYDRFFDMALINARDAAGLNNIVSVGDSISFGDSGSRYHITGIESLNWTPPGGTIQEPYYKVYFRNGYSGNPYVQLLPVSSANSSRKVPFKIFRRPVRNELAVLQLPRGVCIDLSCSGYALSMGSSGLSGAEFSAKYLSGQLAPPLREYGSVSILFSPNGEVCRVTSGVGNFGRTDIPINDVYLMLGRVDRVSPQNELEPYDASGNKNVQSDALTGNLMSGESLWIKINRSNGRVTTANVDGIGGPVTNLTQRLRESRVTASLGLTRGAK